MNGTEPAVRPEIVSLEVVAFVEMSRVIVPDAEVRSAIVVVARLDVPVTTKVLVVVAFVVVLFVAVRLSMNAVATDSRLEKNDVDVALSKNP